MKGEYMFNPPDNPAVILFSTDRLGSIYNYVRPTVECTDYCHNCKGKDQTGGNCRHCKWFRVFKK